MLLSTDATDSLKAVFCDFGAYSEQLQASDETQGGAVNREKFQLLRLVCGQSPGQPIGEACWNDRVITDMHLRDQERGMWTD